MPSIDRATILTGPCQISFSGQTFWSKGDVIFKPNYTRFDIETSRFGKVDNRYSDKKFEVSFEPDGRFTAALAAVLWPYAAMDVGDSLYGATDTPLIIFGRDGKKITLFNTALTEMPGIRLGVSKTIQGNCKFTGLLKNKTDPGAADAYYKIETAAYPGDAGFSTADIKTLAYKSTWGAAPWADFLTEAGWDISFALQTFAQMADGTGTVDMRLQGLTVTAKAIPVGPGMEDVLQRMGHAMPLGSSMVPLGGDLVIAAPGVSVTISQAVITDTDMAWATAKKRLGTTTWTATRSITGGVATPLFKIAAA